MSDLTWLAATTSVPLAWLVVCAAMNHRETAAAAMPLVTDPGAEAHRALTRPQPFPTGMHRRPGPAAEFEGTRHLAACDCGRPIPNGRVAYCSDRCRWTDDHHGSN
ncbi:hypothetical protein PV350_31290 [Streptomyces sp. PA03-6a]|nr:hypothetical protein [Streptomyces sp. PA03-6a]